MTRQLTIKWWNYEDREFTEQEQAVLQISGIKRAEEMIEESYICGELNETLPNLDDVRGWWEYKEIHTPKGNSGEIF